MQTAGFQCDNYIDALMRTDALLEYAVQHGMPPVGASFMIQSNRGVYSK